MPWPEMCNCLCCGIGVFVGEGVAADAVEGEGGARGLAGGRIGVDRADPIASPDLILPCCACCCTCCGGCGVCRDTSNNPLNPSTNLSLSPSTNRCRSSPYPQTNKPVSQSPLSHYHSNRNRKDEPISSPPPSRTTTLSKSLQGRRASLFFSSSSFHFHPLDANHDSRSSPIERNVDIVAPTSWASPRGRM